jgi:S-adenosyl methyltransferase
MTVAPPACDSYTPPTAPHSSAEPLIIPPARKAPQRQGSTEVLNEPGQLQSHATSEKSRTGKDNYAADRQAVRQLLKAAPEARDSARANRAFLQRAVRFLAGQADIRQIIDIGTGIPAAGNVHELAGQVAPGTRVAYLDNDRCESGCAHARSSG